MKKKNDFRVRWVFFSLFLLSVHLSIPDANSLNKPVAKLCSKLRYKQNTVGVVIGELERDSLLVSINRDKLFNPASLMKLFTASAAFDLLGIPYRFKTEVYKDGVFSHDSGVIHGDLYIKGKGDPGFLAEQLWVFVQHLSHIGIRVIEKDLILDDTFFDSQLEGPGWEEDLSSNAYEAPVGALSANFNTVAVYIAPSGKQDDPVKVTLFPKTKGVTVLSTALTTDSAIGDAIQVSTQKKDNKTIVRVSGRMGKDVPAYYIYRKIYSPSENFGHMISELLQEVGIVLHGTIRNGSVPDSILVKNPLYTFASQPLDECIGSMFKYSSNFTAEMVLKTLGAEKVTVPGSWEKGSKTLMHWWLEYVRKAPIRCYSDSCKPVIRNGSGLGGDNRLTCGHIATVLKYVWKKKTYTPEYLRNLSIAGVDGTLKRRFVHSPLKGIIRGKTGTLNDYGVSNIAGYMFLGDKTYFFVVCIQDKSHTQVQHWKLQEMILETVAEHIMGK